MSYFKTSIAVTEEERQQVEAAQKCSGMYLSGGQPMGDPQSVVARLAKKYGLPPDETAFDLPAGLFHVLDTPANREIVEQALKRLSDPATSPVYQISVQRDGNQWCALIGDDLQSGVAGFGDSPRLALLALAGDAKAFANEHYADKGGRK